MHKGNFGGNWLDYWTLILLGEILTLKVEGYGEISIKVERFVHDNQLQGTSFEGVEQVDEGQTPKISRNGAVVGALHWNVDRHIVSPPTSTVILAPWIEREASQYL